MIFPRCQNIHEPPPHTSCYETVGKRGGLYLMIPEWIWGGWKTLSPCSGRNSPNHFRYETTVVVLATTSGFSKEMPVTYAMLLLPYHPPCIFFWDPLCRKLAKHLKISCFKLKWLIIMSFVNLYKKFPSIFANYCNNSSTFNFWSRNNLALNLQDQFMYQRRAQHNFPHIFLRSQDKSFRILSYILTYFCLRGIIVWS